MKELKKKQHKKDIFDILEEKEQEKDNEDEFPEVQQFHYLDSLDLKLETIA